MHPWFCLYALDPTFLISVVVAEADLEQHSLSEYPLSLVTSHIIAVNSPDKMNVKIYFSGSLSRCVTDVDVYRRHIERLEDYGQVVNKDIVGKGASLNRTDVEIFNENLENLKTADVLVAEVTQPSLGVGYEIGLATALKKRVLCLYRPEVRQVLSPMIAGSDNDDDFIVKYYREREAASIFRDIFGCWFSKGNDSESTEPKRKHLTI